ncbi:venom dipeptidyl peptidase 4 [Caerostris extrusa]|uniref:Venom dipeptidyl peptidase 4 n=1 Tax=Caerostris extrusa TaxID=172846 RepID=A0AAV4Y709_CAEEX|nr:venom dipeptidyl peptidase 4 [Caerostris extrusa]
MQQGFRRPEFRRQNEDVMQQGFRRPKFCRQNEDVMQQGFRRPEFRWQNMSVMIQGFLVLDTNSDLKQRVEQRTMPQIRTFHVPVRGGYKAQVRLLLPPDLASNDASLYPLVVYV